jgi:hypothetical protein
MQRWPVRDGMAASSRYPLVVLQRRRKGKELNQAKPVLNEEKKGRKMGHANGKGKATCAGKTDAHKVILALFKENGLVLFTTLF